MTPAYLLEMLALAAISSQPARVAAHKAHDTGERIYAWVQAHVLVQAITQSDPAAALEKKP